MKKINKTPIHNNQSGFAAFFVTLMVMTIFGILILSFAQISNRQGINSLNRVLSTQALYAAQSGINNTYSVIRYYENTGKPVPQQTTSCNDPYYTGGNVGSAKYTCILVNTNPHTLRYQCPTYCPNNAIISHIASVGNVMDHFAISWTDSSRSISSCSSGSAFLPASSWSNCLEVLRIDLVPFQPGTTTPSQLGSSVRTFFLYPQNIASSTVDFSSLNSGSAPIIGAACQGDNCSSTISGLDTNSTYYIRVQFYYGTPQIVDFNGYDASGSRIPFSNSQIQIDATGLSSTVLKRLSAYINPLGSGSSPYSLPLPPNFALQSNQSICKPLIVDNYYHYLYAYGQPGNIDPYTALNYQLTPSSSSYSLPAPPDGPGVPTPTPSPSSIAPTLIGQTEPINTNSGVACNPI
jgi:Tfp pilus assembly protein PilX